MRRRTSNRARKLSKLIPLLRRRLSSGSKPKRGIQQWAHDRGYSYSTLDRAKRYLGVVHNGGSGPGSETFWSLPARTRTDEHSAARLVSQTGPRTRQSRGASTTYVAAAKTIAALSITDTRLSTLVLPPTPGCAPPFEVILHVDRVDYASVSKHHELQLAVATANLDCDVERISSPRRTSLAADLPVLIEAVITDGLSGCSHRGRHYFASPPRQRLQRRKRQRRARRANRPRERKPEYYRQCQEHVSDYTAADATHGSLRYDPSHAFMPAFRYMFTHDRDRYLDLRCVAAQRQAIEDALHGDLLPDVGPDVALLQLSYLELSLDVTRQPSRWGHRGSWDSQLWPIVVSLIQVHKYRVLDLRLDQREIVVGSRDRDWFLRIYDRRGRVRVEMAYKGSWLRKHGVNDVQDLHKLPLHKLLHYKIADDLNALRNMLATALLQAIGDTLDGQSTGERSYTPVAVPAPKPLAMVYRSPRKRDRQAVRRARAAGPGWETVADAVGESAADRLYGFGLLSTKEWSEHLMASPELEDLYDRRVSEDMSNDPVWAAQHLAEVIPELEVALKAARHIGERASILVVLDAALQAQRALQAYQAGEPGLYEADARSAVSVYVALVFVALNIDVWMAMAA